MSDQLDRRIRQAMQRVVDESPPPPDLRAFPPNAALRRRRTPGWVYGVASAAALLAVVGGVALLFDSGLSGTGDPGVVDSEVGPLQAPAPMTGAADGHTVSVTVSGLTGHAGDDLAGVLYVGDELTDLDRDAIGGFWSVISGAEFTTTAVLRQPGPLGVGRFPFVSNEALTVEPGMYTLVVWVDDALNPVSGRVPINTDGMGLFGCHAVFEVGEDAQTDIVVPANLHPDGWNTDCATGQTIPGTNAADAVTPFPGADGVDPNAAFDRRSPSGESPDGVWRWTAINEPWVWSIIDVAPLPGGGFVVAATDEWSILWSPDGFEWTDADPRREVTVLPLNPSFEGSRPQVVTAIGDRVAVVDTTLFGVKIGDLETQSWDSIEFDSSDLGGDLGLLMVGSNETHVLVIGYEDDYGDSPPESCREEMRDMVVPATRYLAWLVDPLSGQVERHSIPATHDPYPQRWAAARVCDLSYGSVAWFKDRWVLNLGELWFVSPDGATWTQTPMPGDPVLAAVTLTAGPETLLAETGGMECNLWYSGTGTRWIEAPDPGQYVRGPADATGYSEVFGYVATPWSDPGLYTSPDGRTWLYTPFWPDVDHLTGSGDKAFAIGEFHPAYLFRYHEPAGSN